MNASCMTCRNVGCVAVQRAGGYAPFFYCPVRGRQWTHLMPGERLECHDAPGDGGITTPEGEPTLPVEAEEVPA